MKRKLTCQEKRELYDNGLRIINRVLVCQEESATCYYAYLLSGNGAILQFTTPSVTNLSDSTNPAPCCRTPIPRSRCGRISSQTDGAGEPHQ